jgi:two-component system response regulator CpxR
MRYNLKWTESLANKISSLAFTCTGNALVNCLILNKNRAVSKAELQTSVLADNFSTLVHNLDIHLSNIRHKLIQSGCLKDVVSP